MELRDILSEAESKLKEARTSFDVANHSLCRSRMIALGEFLHVEVILVPPVPCESSDPSDQAKDLPMSSHKAALLIQRYANEALTALHRPLNIYQARDRLTDLTALARDIANDLQPIDVESSEAAGS